MSPAARVLFVPLKVLLTEELPQTRHAVNALRFTFVLPVKLCQAEVAVAPNAGVRQQPQMREAVLQKSVLLGKGQGAVSALKAAVTPLLLVAREGFQRGETAATRFANIRRH